MSDKEIQLEKHYYGLMQMGWKSDNLVAFAMFYFDKDGKLVHHRIDYDLAKKVCDTLIGKGIYESLNLESYKTEAGIKNLYEKLDLRYWVSLQKSSNGLLRYSKTAQVSVPKYEEKHFDGIWNIVI